MSRELKNCTNAIRSIQSTTTRQHSRLTQHYIAGGVNLHNKNKNKHVN